MNVKITQKSSIIDGKRIAYIDVEIVDKNYSYKVNFKEKTKIRFNTFARKQGFVIGEVNEDPTPKTIILKGE